MFTNTTKTTEIIQNLVYIHGQVISLSNIKNVKKNSDTSLQFKIIEISYHNDPNVVQLVYHKDKQSLEERQTDFEDILMCLGLGDSV